MGDMKEMLISAVGKTSLVTQYETKTYTRGTPSTIGVSFSAFNILVEDCKVKMQIWDTAGQERFRAMGPLYYRGADAAILVYDITNRSSLEDMKAMCQELLAYVAQKRPVLVVAANKNDLLTNSTPALHDGKIFASEILAGYFETSAKLGDGVSELFLHVATEIANRSDKYRKFSTEYGWYHEDELPLTPDSDIATLKLVEDPVPTKKKTGCCR